jgi:hypothetical protein
LAVKSFLVTTVFGPGLPHFSWYNIPKRGENIKWPQNISNGHKIYQMATKYIKWPQNIPNGHKIFQMAVK